MKISQQEINRITSFKRLLCKDESEGPERLAGMFYKGYITTLASPAGTGKTWFMELIACCLSTGKSFLPDFIDHNYDHTPRKTIILEGEGQDKLLNQRLADTNWAWDNNFVGVYNAMDFATDNVPYFINSEQGQRTILTIMEAEHPDIIFFDSLVAWHIANESREDEMIPIFNFLLKLATFYHCAVVLNHHTRKMPANQLGRSLEQDDIVGTGLFARFSRDIFILSKQKDESVRICNKKSWDKALPTFSYTFVTDGCYTDLAFKLDEGKPDTMHNNAYDKAKDIIDNLPTVQLFTAREISFMIDSSVRTARETLHRLVQEGYIHKTKIPGQQETFFSREAPTSTHHEH